MSVRSGYLEDCGIPEVFGVLTVDIKFAWRVELFEWDCPRRGATADEEIVITYFTCSFCGKTIDPEIYLDEEDEDLIKEYLIEQVEGNFNED